MNRIITPESMAQLVHRIEKSAAVDDEMRDICCFVECRYTTIIHDSGKKPRVHIQNARGLRLQNTIYYLDGKMQLLNSEPKSLVKKVYDGIPDWADERLISIYNAFYNRKDGKTDGAE
jgi:hypothetical protein